MKIIRRIRPKTIILSHFDDAFPPISRSINTRRFQLNMKKRLPFVRVIRPEAGIPVEIVKEPEIEKNNTQDNEKKLAIEQE